MRVLVVSHLLGRRAGGGVPARAAAVAGAIAREGASVRVAGTDARLAPAEREELADLAVTIVRAVPQRFPVPLITPARLAALVRWADVVLLFNHWTAFNAAVYAAARRLRVPYVACPCGALPIRGRSRALKHAYELTVGRRLMRDAAICVATTARERAELLNGRSAPRRIAVIPNAVAAPASSATLGEDAATTAFRRGLAVGGAPIVLFMGRLDPIKGPDLLIESFARVAPRFPQHVLVLAGPDGGMGPALASLAAARGIGGRVRFAGWIDHHRTRAAYLAAAFLVVPSRSEAMSLVALEAGAVGTPVLITSPCGFDVDGEVGGGLVVEATIEGLATGLQHLIDRADELPRMGARLREHVAAHYVWPVVGRQWFDVCAEAAATSKLG